MFCLPIFYVHRDLKVFVSVNNVDIVFVKMYPWLIIVSMVEDVSMVDFWIHGWLLYTWVKMYPWLLFVFMVEYCIRFC